MPNFPRTDLAVEAEALRSAAAAAQLPGVRAVFVRHARDSQDDLLKQ